MARSRNLGFNVLQQKRCDPNKLRHQPWNLGDGRSRVTEPCNRASTNIVEIANGTHQLRANVRQSFKRRSIHFDAR
jgi:hypothetical protein